MARWQTYSGMTTFFPPDGPQHVVRAEHIERPQTICEIVDRCSYLNVHEKLAVITMCIGTGATARVLKQLIFSRL